MPKFYCEYCGVYLTHSSPSGRKQHCRGRKHINNKIEYYNQLLIEQNQSGILGTSSLKTPTINPFARPLLPNMPFSIPGMMPGGANAGGPNMFNPPHINLPGILPSNITTMPLMQNNPAVEGKAPQWPQMPLTGQGSLPLNPGQIGSTPSMSLSMGPMGTNMMPPPGIPQNMTSSKPNDRNNIPGNFLGNNLITLPNTSTTFVHPANVTK